MRHLYAKRLAAFIVAGAAVVCLTGSATAGFPGANGRMIYKDAGNIVSSNPDGSGRIVVAPAPTGVFFNNPASSADATKIAFDDGNTLWIVNADGTGLHQVLAGLTGSTDPTWSPDGSKLAFTHADATCCSTSIGIINADGTGFSIHLQSWALDSYSQPAWSPDGSKIAYQIYESGPQGFRNIAVMNATGSVCGDINCGWTFWTADHAGTDTSPNWSPDSTQVVFRRYVSLVGGHVMRIAAVGVETDLTPGISDNCFAPAWSPDGTTVVCERSSTLWTLSAVDGSGLTQLAGIAHANRPDWAPRAANNTAVSAGPQTVTLGSVAITFDSVTVAGNTTVTTSTTVPTPPVGFNLSGAYYELKTTASFPRATVCFQDVTVTSASQLLHFEGGVWKNVATTVTPGVSICGVVTSFSPFVVGVPIDTTPPSLSVSHVANGSNGWNVTAPVAVSISASDAESGLAGTPVCTDTFNGLAPSALTVTGSAPNFAAVAAGDGVHEIKCTVSDVATNKAAAGDTVKLDTQAPVVLYTGNAGTYAANTTVDITCTATDPTPGSGLASSTCANIAGPAYSFAPGPNAFSATATDVAGNTARSATSFTVTVTVGTLCTLTKQFVQSSPRYALLTTWQKAMVDQLATGFCLRLAATFPQLTPTQKVAFVRAYTAGAQLLVSLGWLTQPQATTLIGLANAL
jgi:Tol biopolymer transport system component